MLVNALTFQLEVNNIQASKLIFILTDKLVYAADCCIENVIFVAHNTIVIC